MDKLQRAARAKALLDDPLLKDAFDVLLEEQRALMGTECTDAQLQEAHRMVRALRRVQDRLTAIVTDGKMLERRIEKGAQHRG